MPLEQDWLAMTASLEYPNPNECLAATEFLDVDAPVMNWCLDYLDVHECEPCAKAIEIFEFVRDEIDFVFGISCERPSYKASSIIDEGRGFCTQRAIVLCTLARAAGIPSILLFSSLRDESLPRGMVQYLRTNVIYQHGLSALYLDGRWLKADVGPSPDQVIRKAYQCVQFDGKSDGLLSETLLTDGNHATYLEFDGPYMDLPFEEMMASFSNHYPHLTLEELAGSHKLWSGEGGARE